MNKQSSKTKAQTGQIAIVILLIMVVLLTVGLSLASRTTQDLFLSQQESESARVFNAAEVGIEEALSQDFSNISGEVNLSPSTVTNVTTNTTINPNSTLETKLVEGEAVQIDLQGYVGPLNISWAREENCFDDIASLLVSIYYTDGFTTKVVHHTFGARDASVGDCNGGDDIDVNGVTASDPPYTQTITLIGLPANTLFARIRPLYNDTDIKVSGNSGFPTQFFVIRSQASTDIGEESRTVEVGRTLSGAPSFMDYALYSGGDIIVDAVP